MKSTNEALPINTLLHNGKYKITEMIGNGSFAIIYIAKTLVKGNKFDANTVIIKEFFSRKFSSREEKKVVVKEGENPENINYLKSFLKHEADNLNIIKNNKNIDKRYVCNIIDQFDENNTFYMVYEHIEGDNLAVVIQKDKQKEDTTHLNEVTKIYIQLLEILNQLHREGIIHFDISPKNILINTNTKKPVLIDFGAACIFNDENKMDNEIYSDPQLFDHVKMFNTKPFCPLEIEDKKVAYDTVNFVKDKPQTIDLYALAACMYYYLTGEMPKTASEYAENNSPAIFSPGTKKTILHRAIEAAMQTNINKRTPTSEKTLEILQKGVTPPPPPPPPRPGKRSPIHGPTDVVFGILSKLSIFKNSKLYTYTFPGKSLTTHFQIFKNSKLYTYTLVIFSVILLSILFLVFKDSDYLKPVVCIFNNTCKQEMKYTETKAINYYINSKYDSAIIEFEKIDTVISAIGYEIWGKSCLEKKDTTNAIKNFQIAYAHHHNDNKLDFKFPETINYIGYYWCEKQHNYDSAVYYCLENINYFPGNPNAYAGISYSIIKKLINSKKEIGNFTKENAKLYIKKAISNCNASRDCTFDKKYEYENFEKEIDLLEL